MEFYLLIITIFLLAVALLAKVLPGTLKIKDSTLFLLLVAAFVLCSLFPFFITSLGAIMTFSFYTCLLVVAGFALAYLEEPVCLLKASTRLADREEELPEEPPQEEIATEITTEEEKEELPLTETGVKEELSLHEAEVEEEAQEEPPEEPLPEEIAARVEAEEKALPEIPQEPALEMIVMETEAEQEHLIEEILQERHPVETEGEEEQVYDLPSAENEPQTEVEYEDEPLAEEYLQEEHAIEAEVKETNLQKVEHLEEEAVFESEIKEEETQEPVVLEKAEEETVLPEFEEKLCLEAFLPNFEPDEELAAVSQEEIGAEEVLVEVKKANISDEGGHRESVMEAQHKESIEELVAKGFAARRAGNNRAAVEHFFAALDCDPNEELKVLLTLEAAAVYQELGHYNQAVMLLASVLSGGELRDKALKEELRAQMYTLESISRMLGLAKTPDLPFSQVPRVIRLKAGVEAAERLKKTKEEE